MNKKYDNFGNKNRNLPCIFINTLKTQRFQKLKFSLIYLGIFFYIF